MLHGTFIDDVARTGGVFSLLVFWHFVADWAFQTHKEAMAKAKDRVVRLIHCLKYGAAFVPVLLFLGLWGDHRYDVSLCLLVASHYVIDSYVPVVLWAKHLRRAPQFDDVVRPVTLTKEQLDSIVGGTGRVKGVGWSDNVVDRITYASDEEAFKAFASTPIGCILMVTIDQLLHVAFLLPVAWLVTHP